MRKSKAVVAALFLAILASGPFANAQTPEAAAKPADTTPAAPAVLPGNGLAQHDFFYSGESHRRRMFIVKNGEIVWQYEDAFARGEISDAVMLSNGNILYAHQFGVTEISPDKKILWNFDAPAGREIHTAVPIGKDRVMFIMNGDPALLRVVNIATGAVEKEMKLEVNNPKSVHGQFRHMRLTPQGTLLVAHMDLSQVREYDENGKVLWCFPGKGIWGVTPLANGNALIMDSIGAREVTRRGDTVYSVDRADAKGYKLANLQNAWRLPNGDTVINNWPNEWEGAIDTASAPVQALEFTPDKKIVWALRSWTPPNDLGPATTIQFLGDPTAMEDVHFGDIK